MNLQPRDWHFLALLLLFPLLVDAQEEFLVVSYNVENFLTPSNWQDSTEYTRPEDRITVAAFKEKASSISRALRLMAGRHSLGLIGLCEVDSRRVLNELVYQTPLKQGNYSILHHDSPDHRGIDVALLYQRNLLRLRNVRWLGVHLPSDTSIYPTRELLYASFLLPHADTLHVVQCHLPSQMTAQVNPVVVLAVLAQLQHVLDSVRSVSPQAKIVVMGDMNMPVTDPQLATLSDTNYENAKRQNKLLNWALFLPDSLTYPTYNYKGEWSRIDAFFLSLPLLDTTGWNCHPYHWNYAFLLEKDLEYGGNKPRRTRKGIAFRSGYSDHLPIGLLLRYR